MSHTRRPVPSPHDDTRAARTPANACHLTPLGTVCHLRLYLAFLPRGGVVACQAITSNLLACISPSDIRASCILAQCGISNCAITGLGVEQNRVQFGQWRALPPMTSGARAVVNVALHAKQPRQPRTSRPRPPKHPSTHVGCEPCHPHACGSLSLLSLPTMPHSIPSVASEIHLTM